MFKRTKQLIKVNTLLKEETERFKKEYERKVQEADRLAYLLNEMNMGYLVCLVIAGETGVPAEFIVEYANDGIIENGRLKGKAIIGQSLRELLPSFAESLEKICKEAVSSGNRTSFIAYDEVEDRYLKFICYEEEESRCACVIIDITDRFLSEKLLEDKEERYQSLFQVSEEFIFELDLEGRFTYISEGIRKVLGYEPEEQIGRYYYEQYPVDVRKNAAYVFQKCFNECGQEIHGLMTELIAKDGRHHYAMQNGIVLMDEDGRDVGYRGIYIDVTELQKARKKAEVSIDTKEEIVEKIGQEIKSPLNGIIGLTSLALNEPRMYKVYQYLKKMEESAMELLHIMNSMLDYSELTKDEIRLYEEAFSLQLVIKKVTGFLAVKAEEKKIRLAVDLEQNVPDTFSGDSTRLTQILTNLLSTTIRYMSEGELTVIIRKREKGLLFIIKENSTGSKEDLYQHIYEPFADQESATAANSNGNKIDMVVSKQLIDAMGGRIKVLAKEGIKIYLALPLRQCKEDLVRSTERDVMMKSEIRKYHGQALVIIEDATSEIVLSDLLKMLGVTVSIAKEEKTARKLMQQERFDLIFLDILLPNALGIKANLRKEKGNVPVIVIRTNPVDTRGEDFGKVEAEEYITKPFDLYKLEYILKKYIPLEDADSLTACTVEQDIPIYPFTHIDYCRAVAQLDNDQVLYNKIAFSFVKEYKDDTTKLLELAAKNKMDARVYIHSMKGIAQTLGAFELSAMARQIEEMLLLNKMDQGLIGLYTTELKAVLSELIPYAESVTIQSHRKGYDQEKGKALLERLERLLVSHDATAVDEIGAIYEVLYSEEEKEQVELLIHQIEQYEFEQAEETLRTIGASLGVKG